MPLILPYRSKSCISSTSWVLAAASFSLKERTFTTSCRALSGRSIVREAIRRWSHPTSITRSYGSLQGTGYTWSALVTCFVDDLYQCDLYPLIGKYVPIWYRERDLCPEANELPWPFVSWPPPPYTHLTHHTVSPPPYTHLTHHTQSHVQPPPPLLARAPIKNGWLRCPPPQRTLRCLIWSNKSPSVPTRRLSHLLYQPTDWRGGQWLSRLPTGVWGGGGTILRLSVLPAALLCLYSGYFEGINFHGKVFADLISRNSSLLKAACMHAILNSWI